MRRFFFIAFLLFFPLAQSASALDELRNNYLSTRSKAMGGAGVATDESEEAVFLNPAGLAGFEHTQLYIPSCTAEASGGIYSDYSTLSTTFSSFSFTTLNKIVGKTLDFRGQCAAIFAAKYFGIAYITDNQYYLSSQNIVMPQFIIGAQNTNGVQAAFGFPVWKSGTGKKKEGGHELRVGVGIKEMFRRGGYYTLGMSELLSASRTTYAKLVGSYGSAYGFDFGLQYKKSFNKHLKLMAGVSFTDIGNTTFPAPATPTSSNLTWGLAAAFQANSLFGAKLAYDYAHVLQENDWRKKNHFGLEIDIANLSLYTGVNQLYFTYGAAIDFWLIRLSLASYVEETGAWIHDNYDRRYLLKIDIRLNI